MTKLVNQRFQDLCINLSIKLKFSLVEHTLTNMDIELANRITINELKKRLDQTKAEWIDKLIGLLCVYDTTPKSSTHKASFKLVNRSDTTVPIMKGNYKQYTMDKQKFSLS